MKWLTLAGLCLLLQACGGGSGDDSSLEPQACSLASQQQSLRDFMQEEYYWYTSLRAPDETAPTLDAYFQSMLYRPTDRYSFTESTAAHNQLFVAGRRVGYGYALVWADAARTALRIRNIEPLSPAARAGLVRGDTVLAIDDVLPQGIADGQLPLVDTVGVPRTFALRNSAGQTRVVTVVSEDFSLSPLAAAATFDVMRAGVPVKVGYLAYHQFVNYSVGSLSTEFYRFGAAGIVELILDLRYNGGGSVNASRDLASMIGGSRTASQLYAYLRFNNKNANSTQQVRFNSSDVAFAHPLPQGLPRVVVIASGGTASASELLINGLRPFVDVVLVGDTTYGKPYGFIPRDNCGTTYNAVQFEALNSQGVGGYTAGLAPTCSVPDDLDHPLGSAGEGRIRAALDYIVTGSCTAPGTAALGAPKPRPAPGTFGETVPVQMFQD